MEVMDQSISKEIQELKDKNYTGAYKFYHPISKKLRLEGNFSNGSESGLWKQIDEDGDQKHFQYSQIGVGATCQDGTRSYSTGSGTCSHHGGVAKWLYENRKQFVKGTGKHQPFQELQKEIAQRFQINKTKKQFFFQVMRKLKELDDQRIENQKIAKNKILKDKQLQDQLTLKERQFILQNKKRKKMVFSSDEDEKKSCSDTNLSIEKVEGTKKTQNSPSKVIEIEGSIQVHVKQKKSIEVLRVC